MAIGAIATFFGMRYGKYNIDRIFKTIGLTKLPQGNKSEKISAILMHYLKKDRTLFTRCLEILIQYHQLTPEDIVDLRTHTLCLGYDIKDEHVVSSLGKEIVVSEGRPYDAFRIIEKILLSAKNRLHVIDPYVDESLFDLYLADLPLQVDIKILTKNMSGKFKAVAQKFKSQRLNFEVRVSDEIHDRYILVDNRAWMFGQSLKNAGNKTLGIVEYENSDPIEKAFVQLWNKGKKIL